MLQWAAVALLPSCSSPAPLLLLLQLDLLNYSIISKSIGNIRLRPTCRLPQLALPYVPDVLGSFILSSFRPYNQLDTYERASTRHTRQAHKLPPPAASCCCHRQRLLRCHVQWRLAMRERDLLISYFNRITEKTNKYNIYAF